MKWTTANVKNLNYISKHEIYVGTQTGSFKKLTPTYEQDPYAQKNLQDISKLDKDSRITALAFGNAEQTEILIGRAHNIVELHSLDSEKVEKTVEFQAAPVVSVARYNEHIVAGISNGQIQCVMLNAKTSDAAKNIITKTGDDMSHMRQCAAARNIIATGGKGRQNNLKVFDIAADGKQIFNSKNLPNDYLQLEVPVWDSDVGFIDGPHTLATCSRYGYVRFYDTRKQRRPVQCFATENQMSFSTLAAHGNYIYAGTTMGVLKAFDIRRMKTFVHTYKGFTGGISDLYLDLTGKYLSSACLDRYVRVHDVDSTVLLYQCYVKSKASKVLIHECIEDYNENEPATEDAIIFEGPAKSKEITYKTATNIDKEYEDMFESMQTICENVDDEDQLVVDVSEVKSNKRKTPIAVIKNKKKKQ